MSFPFVISPKQGVDVNLLKEELSKLTPNIEYRVLDADLFHWRGFNPEFYIKGDSKTPQAYEAAFGGKIHSEKRCGGCYLDDMIMDVWFEDQPAKVPDALKHMIEYVGLNYWERRYRTLFDTSKPNWWIPK